MTALAIRQGTDAWLEYRRAHITATDAAIIAGETGSAIDLWALKRGLVEEPAVDPDSRLLMDDGLAIQPFLLDAYARRTGNKVREVHNVRQSDDWPVASCSPDGEVIGELVGIEAKMSTAGKWRTSEDVPGDVLAQVQWQMYVTGWLRVDVVALVYGRVRVIEVMRDPEYIDDLLALARQFHGWVISGERPPLDGSENARRVLAALYPRNDGTLLDAPADVLALIRDIDAAKAEVKGSEDLIATMENTLRALIGDADGFAGEWGRVTWKGTRQTDWLSLARELDPPADLVAMHTSTNWKAVAETLRPRKEAIARHSSPTGSRRIDIRLKGDAA